VKPQTQSQVLLAVSAASTLHRALDGAVGGFLAGYQRQTCLLTRGDAAAMLERVVYLAELSGISADALAKAKLD